MDKELMEIPKGLIREIGHVRVHGNQPIEPLDFKVTPPDRFKVLERYSLPTGDSCFILHAQIFRAEKKVEPKLT